MHDLLACAANDAQIEKHREVPASGPREGCPQNWFALGLSAEWCRGTRVVHPAATGLERATNMGENGNRTSERVVGAGPVAPFDARFRQRDSADPGLPEPRGLYDPALGKASCGVGFIADIKGRKSHQIIQDALTILLNLEHRGAVGADPRAGDGAGILVQIPHKFFSRKCGEIGFALPAPGEYAVGYLFMPRDEAWREVIRKIWGEMILREGMELLGWREVP